MVEPRIKDGVLFREGDFECFYWGGQKRYKCNRQWSTGHPCAYDTYDYEALLSHIAEPHSEGKRKVAAPAARRVTSSILGPDGQPVVREVSDARFKEEE